MITTEERSRRQLLRNIGYVAIGVAYLACFVTGVFGPTNLILISFVCAASVPLVIQGLISRIKVPYEDDNDKLHFIILSIISSIVIVWYIVGFSSETVRTWFYNLVAVVLAFSIVALVLRWIIKAHDPVRRATAVGTVIVLSVLLSCAIFGPPLISWIAIGVGAALAVSLVNPVMTLNEDHVRRSNFLSGLSSNNINRSLIDSERGRSTPFLSLLFQSRHVIQQILYKENYDITVSHEDISVLMTALGGLDNLDFVSREFVGRAHSTISSIEAGGYGENQGWSIDILRQFLSEIDYGIGRVEAHGLGASCHNLVKK